MRLCFDASAAGGVRIGVLGWVFRDRIRGLGLYSVRI